MQTKHVCMLISCEMVQAVQEAADNAVIGTVLAGLVDDVVQHQRHDLHLKVSRVASCSCVGKPDVLTHHRSIPLASHVGTRLLASITILSCWICYSVVQAAHQAADSAVIDSLAGNMVDVVLQELQHEQDMQVSRAADCYHSTHIECSGYVSVQTACRKPQQEAYRRKQPYAVSKLLIWFCGHD